MSHYEVKNKKKGQISILNDEEIAALKLYLSKRGNKISDKFTVTEIKPMRQVISPLAPEIVKPKNPKVK